jgi:hypothetical protein
MSNFRHATIRPPLRDLASCFRAIRTQQTVGFAEIAGVDLSIVLSAGIGKNAWPLDFGKRTVIASVTA